MNTSLNFTDSMLVTVIGISIVFLGLTILIFLIKLLVRFTDNLGKSKKLQEEAATVVHAESQSLASDESVEDDEAMIAAITAAITCMMCEEGSAFRVRHVRRIQQSPAWQSAGRQEQIYSRF